MSKNIVRTTVRTLGAALAAFALFASLAGTQASAQAYYDGNHQNVDGIVTYFNRFDMTLHVAPGQNIPVHLHQGTIINPTGTSLQRGMRVNVRGFENRYGTLEANRIDFDGWARSGYRRY